MSSRSRRATSCPECGRLAAARASPVEIYLIDAGFVIVVPLVFATARHRRPQAVREFDLLSRTYGAASSASGASAESLDLPSSRAAALAPCHDHGNFMHLYTMRNFRDPELLRWRPARGRARAEGAQRVGRSGGSPRRAAGPGLFPHFAPRRMTCCFAEVSEQPIGFGELTVEECGVEWGTVE